MLHYYETTINHILYTFANLICSKTTIDMSARFNASKMQITHTLYAHVYVSIICKKKTESHSIMPLVTKKTKSILLVETSRNNFIFPSLNGVNCRYALCTRRKLFKHNLSLCLFTSPGHVNSTFVDSPMHYVHANTYKYIRRQYSVHVQVHSQFLSHNSHTPCIHIRCIVPHSIISFMLILQWKQVRLKESGIVPPLPPDQFFWCA